MKFLLLNGIQLDGIDVLPGRIFDDQYENVDRAQRAGGQFVTLPNASAETLAAQFQKQHARGRQPVEIIELFSAVAQQAIMGGGAVPASRTLTAGLGLTGGGDLSADRIFNVGAATDGSIVAIADEIAVGVLATDAQHGARGGGTQHANAVPAGAAGFMTGADKTKIDGLVSGGAAFTLGSILFMGAAGALAQDNANFFFSDTNNQLGIGINSFPNTSVKFRVGNPGLSAGLTQLDGATNLGVTTTGTRFNSASLYCSFVCGSYLDSRYDGAGNGGLYAIARAGTAGAPPTLAPFTALCGYDEGVQRSLWFGGGSWGSPDANIQRFFTAPTYTETTDTGLQRMSIGEVGQVSIGSADPDAIGSLRVDSAVGSVGLRITVGSPSRIGTGGLNVGTDVNPTAGFLFDVNGAGGARFARAAATTGAASNFLYTGAAHTGQTASTETVDVDINTVATLQHATGALTTQRTMVVRARTYSFVAASTITNAATFAIAAAPIAGTNATLTNAYAFWVQAGLSEFDGGIRAVRPLATTGVPVTFQVTPGADTGLTASAETTDIDFNLARAVQHATGALTTQRAMRVRNPTYSFVAASTITDAATVAIDAAPVAGTNATITRSMAFWVQGGTARFDGNTSQFGVPDFGSGTLVGFGGNASVVPTTNPTGGGVYYWEAGALKHRGSGGTVTTIAPA